MGTCIRLPFVRWAGAGLLVAVAALGVVKGLSWRRGGARAEAAAPAAAAPSVVAVALEKPSHAVRDRFRQEHWGYEGLTRVKGYKVRTFTHDMGLVNVEATLVSDADCRVTMLAYLLHWDPATPSEDMQDVLERLLSQLGTVSGDASLAARNVLVKMGSSVEFWEAAVGGRPARIEEKSGDGWIVECRVATAVEATGRQRALLGFGARRAGMPELEAPARK